MIILFKYYVDVENCESFRGFGFIYRYIDYLVKLELNYYFFIYIKFYCIKLEICFLFQSL